MPVSLITLPTLAANAIEIAIIVLFLAVTVGGYLLSALKALTENKGGQPGQYGSDPVEEGELTVEEIAERRREELRRRHLEQMAEAEAQRHAEPQRHIDPARREQIESQRHIDPARREHIETQRQVDPQRRAYEETSGPPAQVEDQEARRRAAREAYEQRMRQLREAQSHTQRSAGPPAERPRTEPRPEVRFDPARSAQSPIQVEPQTVAPAAAPVGSPPTVGTISPLETTQLSAPPPVADAINLNSLLPDDRRRQQSRRKAVKKRPTRAPRTGGIPRPGHDMPTRTDLRHLLVWKEVLDPPLALRKEEDQPWQ